MRHQTVANEVDTTLFPWETIDTLTHDQIEAEMWADVEHEEWLASLFADDQPEAMPASDPLFAEWWDNGAQSVAGQWTMLDSAKVLPDYQRDDWVGA